MDAIMAVARQHGLAVIEDACHVWGSSYGGRDIGTIGAAAFYSYDPGKPFIIGMGGAAVVNDEGLSEQVRRLYGDLKSPGVLETTLLNLQYLAHRLTRQPRLFWLVRDFYRFLSRKGVAVATWSSSDFQGKLGPDYNKRLPRLLQMRLLAMMQRGEEIIARHQRLFQRYERGLRELGVPEIQRDPRAMAVMICCPLQVMNKSGLLSWAIGSAPRSIRWKNRPGRPLAMKRAAARWQKP
jgi:dTDP-4-amino-4,6-dideoxygalactose transaminase